ncbi:hypothetical protein D3C78_1673520 [compost metagenome]
MEHELHIHFILSSAQRPQRVGTHHGPLLLRYRHVVTVPIVAIRQLRVLPFRYREQQLDPLIRGFQLHALYLWAGKHAAQQRGGNIFLVLQGKIKDAIACGHITDSPAQCLPFDAGTRASC